MHVCAVEVSWIQWHLKKLVGINFSTLKIKFLNKEKTKKYVKIPKIKS